MNFKIAPSLMCMNLMDLPSELAFLNKRIDFYHVDIMDGHFVPNLTLSPYFVSQISPYTTAPIDCHLMVTNPENLIDPLISAGADMISMQCEVIGNQAFRLINKIKEAGKQVGIVINPATPLNQIEAYLSHLDKVTVMTVDPGFAGQTFIPESLDKVRALVKLREKHSYKYLIEVDGSCNKTTYQRMYAAGAEVLVMGSSGLFGINGDLPSSWKKMVDDMATAVMEAI
ncbi:D-allulose 6-phosphate 3-epimerase [Vibrio rumoiensis]|uniref:D-allulose 6-phosphate 3-epimerase n=1 Tax=Vibrio rumoiensis TaxID=76258 RepID=UPI000B5C5382|nr:D-allulose 6-phosphate 3-epimerase [Vibrio rumoiensis]